jgi:hypothetical protein
MGLAVHNLTILHGTLAAVATVESVRVPGRTPGGEV